MGFWMFYGKEFGWSALRTRYEERKRGSEPASEHCGSPLPVPQVKGQKKKRVN